MLATLGEDKQTVSVARWRDKILPVKGYQFKQGILVQVIEVVAERYRGVLMGKQAGDDIVLAIVIEHVCHVTALLEHVTAAGEVVGPCLCHFRPGLVAVEPLAIDHQSQTRPLVIDRLVGTLVDDKAVGAA